jgi:hypothetical protein
VVVVRRPYYRWGEDKLSAIFDPIHRLDRSIRPDTWRTPTLAELNLVPTLKGYDLVTGEELP